MRELLTKLSLCDFKSMKLPHFKVESLKKPHTLLSALTAWILNRAWDKIEESVCVPKYLLSKT